MPDPGRIRFTIQIPKASSRQEWQDKARRAEDAGFYALSLPDHLGPSFPQLAPLVALASAAAVTSTLRLTNTVLDNDFRHPVMLAKEIATLDLLSDGRVDMGLGAGWLEEDYQKTGVATWDPPSTRVGRLFESVDLLRQLFTGESVTFTGEHYQVSDYSLYPMPVQSPVPLLVGAREKRMITFGAKHAQILNLLPSRVHGADGAEGVSGFDFERQIGWIREAGGFERDDFGMGLRLPFCELAAPGETVQSAAERFGASWGLTADEVLESPFLLVGDLPRIKDRLVEIREHFGISYVTFSEDFAWQLAPIVADLST